MRNNPNKVILHCSATGDNPFKSLHSIEDVRKWHKSRGWDDIGYHAYIDRLGEIAFGRDESIIGAHTLGHNTDSLGVCYEGTYLPTINQISSLMSLYRLYLGKYKLGYNRWFGHNNFTELKSCPGFDVEFLRDLFKKVAVSGEELRIPQYPR